MSDDLMARVVPPDARAATFTLRLHRTGWNHPERLDDVDWYASAVGNPVTFAALHSPMTGMWRPIDRIAITAPCALETPAWTVWTDLGGTPVRVMANYVGHSLAAGETYELPRPGDYGGVRMRESPDQPHA